MRKKRLLQYLFRANTVATNYDSVSISNFSASIHDVTAGAGDKLNLIKSALAADVAKVASATVADSGRWRVDLQPLAAASSPDVLSATSDRNSRRVQVTDVVAPLTEPARLIT